MERADEYEKRREKVKKLTDEELKKYFWELVQKIIDPLVAEAKQHTSPSIERSVLLRMGFSSLDAKTLVTQMLERGLLEHGAGHVVYRVAKKRDISITDAGQGLIEGRFWEDVGYDR
jgi:D-ornithine 4,5-aminomutase subunit alpha